MKRLSAYAYVALGLGACFLVSCVTKATEDEIRQACTNLVKLRGEVDVIDVAEAVANVEKAYKEKEAKLATRKKEALLAIDTEQKEKVAAIDRT